MIPETIDIFMTCYLRPEMTDQSLQYLRERTKHGFRLVIIHYGGNEEVLEKHSDIIDLVITPSRRNGKDSPVNLGIHSAWNLALSMAVSKYFITTDNDIYVPDLEPDWLTQLSALLDQREEFGAISLHPHVFIGAAGLDHKDTSLPDVVERNMCGAVMRIMRLDAVIKAGGWEHKLDPRRNHEERTICSRLQSLGYKVGITSRIRAYHPFGKKTGGNWGYPEWFTPQLQGHTPELKDYVVNFDNPDAYDQKTWLPL